LSFSCVGPQDKIETEEGLSMEEVPLDELFTDGDLKKWTPQESIVRRNKNHKTISVTGSLDNNRLEIKVIAPYQMWVYWEEAFLEDSRLPVVDILPFLTQRAPKDRVEALQAYFQSDPDMASHDFYSQFLIPANAQNPAYHIPKPRGGSPYKYTRQEMLKIRYTAQHLYVLLQYWLNRPRDEWPSKLRRLEGLPPDPSEAAQELIERAFNIPDNLDADSFQRHYLGWRPLTHIKGFYEKLNYRPRIPYLKLSDLT
jgi:hypothetical protein